MVSLQRQIAALKYLIFMARNGTVLSKQVLAFLIDHSNGMTKEVCLTLQTDREGYTADDIQAAAYGWATMCSCNGVTHLNELFCAMGCELRSSLHYGDFDPLRKDDPFSAAGQFAGGSPGQVSNSEARRTGMPLRYTFWLAKERYSRDATLLVVTRQDLDGIDLARSERDLYPSPV